ncbi:uncharacterized protein FIBRA_06661 [Fibroporia radiculosa]|uniref:C2 NT-type domain-containing protein n=1 Tax=Fibroporia radiculosa TaxID=599839 RepID=J4IBD7_9APHY|nr:uncharacterized protein FIBRA_06661 [Fibroporia radiculosa]CCM04481.1 predicted protein [Fibroporia radiculosa]
MSPEAMKNSRTPSAASTSSASVSTSSDPHQQQHALGYGLRSQFGQLLPRHALFQVHINIDQLSNVPLMSGQFAVRWKFKNVQSRSGLLSKMKGSRSWSSKNKGKGRAAQLGLAIEVTPAEGEGDDVDEESSAQEEGTEDEGYSPHLHANASSGDLLADHDFSPETAVPPVTPTPAPGQIQKTPSSTSTETRSVARGITPWKPLQSYNVKWEHEFNVLVQMDVHRETADLLQNELKLVVMQRVIPGDPDSPRQPRIGAVYLNLAEYADAGPVTRRYLLRESKTNATLKMTVELDFVDGVKHYRPPPLRKGEILASITGLLSNNDLLRTSVARQLDQYTHPEDDDAEGHPFLKLDGSIDTDKLASSAGLRSTEDLIENLFNPVPTASLSPSPFTYYAPPAIRRAPSQSTDASSDSLSLSPSAGEHSMRSASTDSVSGAPRVQVEKLSVESSPDMSTLESAQTNGQRTWWKKIRPVTPVGRHFKLPSPLPPRQHAEVSPA